MISNRRFILLVPFLLLVICSFAQPVHDQLPIRVGVIDKSEKLKKNPIEYPWIRLADYVWEKRVWRVIDLREKINQPLYYPETPINNWKSLMTVILDEVTNTGNITAYKDETYVLPFKKDEVKKLLIDSILTQVPRVDSAGNTNMFDTLIIRGLKTMDIKKIRIMEDWFFDKQRSMMEVRIIGICPVIDRYSTIQQQLVYRGPQPLFWVYFPQVRPFLAKEEIFNRFNGAARLTYDDYFWKRMFSSYIYKEDNQYDRTISDYCLGIDNILESDRVKQDLFNFEQQLWEY